MASTDLCTKSQKTLILPPISQYQEFRTAITAQTEAALAEKQDIVVDNAEALPHVLRIVNDQRPFGATTLGATNCYAGVWTLSPPYDDWEAIRCSHVSCDHVSFHLCEIKRSEPRCLKCDACDKQLSFSDLVRSKPNDAERLAHALDMLHKNDGPKKT